MLVCVEWLVWWRTEFQLLRFCINSSETLRFLTSKTIKFKLSTPFRTLYTRPAKPRSALTQRRQQRFQRRQCRCALCNRRGTGRCTRHSTHHLFIHILIVEFRSTTTARECSYFSIHITIVIEINVDDFLRFATNARNQQQHAVFLRCKRMRTFQQTNIIGLRGAKTLNGKRTTRVYP